MLGGGAVCFALNQRRDRNPTVYKHQQNPTRRTRLCGSGKKANHCITERKRDGDGVVRASAELCLKHERPEWTERLFWWW